VSIVFGIFIGGLIAAFPIALLIALGFMEERKNPDLDELAEELNDLQGQVANLQAEMLFLQGREP